MAFFPTKEEAQGFVTIGAIADWVGLNVLVIPASERQTGPLRQHAPQSGNAPTSSNQGSCQSRENHRNRWPGTTLCTSGSCANCVGLANCGSAFVWRKETEDGTHLRPRRRILVHIRGRRTHYCLVSQLRRDHAQTTRRRGNADERAIIGFEREGGHPTRLPLRRLRCLIVSPLTCLNRTALGWRKRSLVQPIFRHGFIVGCVSVWRV